jgi:hypothetical protein
MTRAICFKEWVKTRQVILLSVATCAGYVVYAMVHTGQLFRVDGAVATWGSVLLKDTFLLPGAARWVPLVAGVMLGLAQFVPEMTDSRLKLTLHLPLPERRVVAVMLLYGAGVLAALYVVSAGVLWGWLARYYPAEILAGMGWRVLPWMVAGIAGYLFTAWTCVEPAWRQRVVNALVALAALPVFYIEATPGSYLTLLPLLAVVVASGFCFPFYSAARFKEGAR